MGRRRKPSSPHVYATFSLMGYEKQLRVTAFSHRRSVPYTLALPNVYRSVAFKDFRCPCRQFSNTPKLNPYTIYLNQEVLLGQPTDAKLHLSVRGVEPRQVFLYTHNSHSQMHARENTSPATSLPTKGLKVIVAITQGSLPPKTFLEVLLFTV